MASVKRTGYLRNSLFVACGIAGLLWTMCAGIVSYQLVQADTGYTMLATSSSSTTSKKAQKQGSSDSQVATPIDHQALSALNSDYAGWLTVENTTISYPLVQAQASQPNYYLKHDFYKNWSSIGCPYIDSRTSLGNRHILAYGHHLGTTQLMFSSLAQAYQRNVFDSLEDAVISTPSGSTLRFTPWIALRVDSTYEPIQSFDWSSEESFISWAQSLQDEKGAIHAKDGALTNITQVLTLVTCSSNTAGQKTRTLVIFVR